MCNVKVIRYKSGNVHITKRLSIVSKLLYNYLEKRQNVRKMCRPVELKMRALVL